jgi:hypothetical protein
MRPLAGRVYLTLVVVETLILSWLGMMTVHELGHVLHARLSGGVVSRVFLHPLSLSYTSLAQNPSPFFVAYGGLLWGSVLPLSLLLVPPRSARLRQIARFFAGFCLVANGAYLIAGAWARTGDPGDLLRLGATRLPLLFAGTVAAGLGLLIWHRLGAGVGFGVHAGLGARLTAAVLGLVLGLVLLVLSR